MSHFPQQDDERSPLLKSADRRGGGFVWPPRRGGMVVDVPADGNAGATPGVEQGSRVAPDAVGESPSVDVIAAATDHVVIEPQRGLWQSLEETWLDLAAAPLERRMRELGWAPGAADSYCGRCGFSVGPFGSDESGCGRCRGRRFAWERMVRLGTYDEPLSRLVQEIKFTRWRRLGRDLGRVLGAEVAAAMVERGAAGPPVVVPVPMSLPRRLARGIDHSLAIARGVADATGGRVCRLLARRHRPSQTAVTRSERASNVAGSMRPRWGVWGRPELRGRLVLVVDDVITTGATMRCACRAVGAAAGGESRVRGVGAKGVGGPVIWAVVAARTEEKDGTG